MLTRIRHSKFLPFLAVVLIVLLAAAPVLTYPMGRDQGMYANIGQSILRGGIPYVDMWDIKPPPIYYIYATGIALFGSTTAAIRAIDFTLIPFGMLGLFLFAEMLKNRRVGLLSALIYGVFYFNEDFQNLTQSDSLVTVPMIWAAYSAYRSMHSQNSRYSWRWALLSGAICGVVLWFKHYYGFFVLALVINRVWAHFKSTNEGKSIWKDGLAFVSGGLLTSGTLLLYFWSQGMIDEMVIVAQGTAAYNAQGYDFGAFIANMQNYWYFRWLTWHTLLLLVGLWFVLKIIPLPTSPITIGEGFETGLERGDKVGWRLLLSCLAAALLFALIQAKGFDTHWIPMLPVMAILAADTLEIMIQFIIRGRGRGVALVLYGLAVIGLISITANTTWGRAWQYIAGTETRVAYFDRFQANDLKPEESLLMAEYLQERVIAGDSLFIWGFRPEVYFMAQLTPATRYQAQFPLVAPWYPVQWRAENVDILRAALPPYALIVQDDFMPWVTNIDADSHTILQDAAHDDLRFWYQAHYERVAEIGDFIIWRRLAP
ncbi:MAG: glycosyltransferase family 39 protein [Anaerolineae bacterium]|nr:glycosyltransferase family 39 protein [Anaerolineae bacterium]